MSSKDCENKDLERLAPPDRLLFLLKTRGPQTAADLGTRLQITPEAARQQLLRLTDEGLVYAKSEIRGVGRPAQVYYLGPAAQRRFPDTHAELTAQRGERREPVVALVGQLYPVRAIRVHHVDVIGVPIL